MQADKLAGKGAECDATGPVMPIDRYRLDEDTETSQQVAIQAGTESGQSTVP